MVTKHKQLMNDGGVSKLHLAVFQGKQDKVGDGCGGKLCRVCIQKLVVYRDSCPVLMTNTLDRLCGYW